MSIFDRMKLIGPRFVDVVVTGNKVFKGLHCIIDNGHFKTLGSRIFNHEIGQVSPFPWHKTVKDFRCKEGGVLEGGPLGAKTLRRC